MGLDPRRELPGAAGPDAGASHAHGGTRRRGGRRAVEPRGVEGDPVVHGRRRVEGGARGARPVPGRGARARRDPGEHGFGGRGGHRLAPPLPQPGRIAGGCRQPNAGRADAHPGGRRRGDLVPLLRAGLDDPRTDHRGRRRLLTRRIDSLPSSAGSKERCGEERPMPFVGGENVVVRQVGDSNWALVEPLVYRGNRETFTAPPGFETQFASVPRALVWLIPRYGRYTKAAILHDFLWRTGVVPRVDANGLFRRVMRELGVPVVRRWIMWAAVGLRSVVKDPGGELRPGWRHVA